MNLLGASNIEELQVTLRIIVGSSAKDRQGLLHGLFFQSCNQLSYLRLWTLLTVPP